MKKLIEIIGKGILLTIFLFILVIFIPFFIFIEGPYSYYRSIKFSKKYQKFLEEQEAKNFFIYNNRKKSLDFIQCEVLKTLSPKIKVLYLEGKILKNEQKDEYYSVMINSLKNYTKFPHLMKVRNGKMIDVSINNEMFNWKSKSKNQKYFFNKLKMFFELEDDLIDA